MKKLGFRLIVVLTSLLTTTAAGGDIRKRWSESAPVAPGMRISVSHGDGDLHFHSVPGAQEVRAEIVYESAAPNPDQDLDVVFHIDTLTFNFVAWEDGEAPKGRSDHDIYRIDVWAPPNLPLWTSGDDGDVLIPVWEADVEVRFDDGQLVAEEISGNFSFLSDDGSATIGQLGGDAKIRTRDGSIRVHHANSASIEVQSLDGDVALGLGTMLSAETLSGETKARSIEVTSDDGRIEIDLLTRDPIRLKASTYEGWIELDAPTSGDFYHSRRRLEGDLFGPSPRGVLHLKTRDADAIIIDRVPEHDTVPPAL